MFVVVLIACQEARCRQPIRSLDRYRRAACAARRLPFRRGRVGARPTSTADPPSRPQARAQPAPCRSDHYRLAHTVHAPRSYSAFRHRLEAFHSTASPQPAEETEVPLAVFFQAPLPAWPQRTEPRTHRGRRSQEATESQGRKSLRVCRTGVWRVR